jgi:hypothetical protein
VNGETGDVVAPLFDLTGVEPDTDLEAHCSQGIAQVGRAAQGTGRAVEDRE